jgi:hypothetical protein
LILLERAADAAVVAEQHFRRAFDLARRQDALFWELRTATSLARLWLATFRRKKPFSDGRATKLGARTRR